MERECWKVVSTDEYKYEFEKQEENWIYILDFKKNGVAEKNYIQIYQDYGWEYVVTCCKWFYFRKKRRKILNKIYQYSVIMNMKINANLKCVTY